MNELFTYYQDIYGNLNYNIKNKALYLRIRLVSECIKYFLNGNNLSCASVNRLPHNAISLEKQQESASLSVKYKELFYS